MNNDKDIESTDGVAAPAGDETRDATDTDVPPVEESADTTHRDEKPILQEPAETPSTLSAR